MATKLSQNENLLSSEVESDIDETMDSDQNDEFDALESFLSDFSTSDDDGNGYSSASSNSEQQPPGKKPKIT